MKREEYNLNEPKAEETIVFSCNQGDDSSHSPPHPTCTAKYPAYVRETQIITPNSGSDRKSWKDFENYRVFRVKPSAYGGEVPIQINGESYLHWDVAKGRNARCGCTGFSGVGNEIFPLGEPGFPVAGLPAFRVDRPDNGFVPVPSNLNDLERRAMVAMLPGIKAELSLINSLVELKDFSSLPRTLSNATNLVSRSLSGGGVRLREILRGGADGYLQAKFNILPLLSDITGLNRALSRTERRINDLVTRAGRPQRRHFAYTWKEFDDRDDESEGYYVLRSGDMPFQQISACHLSRKAVHSPSIFHAEVEYCYNFTQYQREHAHMLGLLDAVGVNFNPAIIWNALPWSFVVDWVINVSKWLDQFKVQHMEPQINIRRYLWSIKRKREVYTWKHSAPFDIRVPGFPNGTTLPLPTVFESAYRRSVSGFPGVSSITSSGLNSNEFSLGAALVLARRR